MDVGVFIPIGNNGWLISENAPQYMPSFELNKAIVQKAEGYGFDFALSMIKLRGFGGKTEFWEHNRVLHADGGPGCRHQQDPAVRHRRNAHSAAGHRRAHGFDHRLDLRRPLRREPRHRLAKARVQPDGPVAGDEFFGTRYQYLGEYARVLRDLWATGRSDFKGEHFQMEDCRVSPKPQADMKIICAGSSDAGMAFSAQYADYNFCFGKGVNTPTAFAPAAERLQAACAKTGRHVTSCVLFMVIADETDEAARAKWEHYKAGADQRPSPGWANRARQTRPPVATPTFARWLTRPRR